ncbi:unnamed protein product [Rotaria sp. Silwood2]|nr:unnamed protein product [Rotaria sp. Silwood2]
MASKQSQELCSECDANATWYCIQDDANFCDQHNTLAHSLKSQKLHKIVSIDEKAVVIRNQAAKPMNCKAHHMPLCLYCLLCKTCRDHIYSKQEDLENINVSLNKCSEEGRHALSLDDFAALSQSKVIMDKMKKLETESVEYHSQVHLTDAIPFRISIQTLLKIIDTSGILGEIPAPSFIQQKCKASSNSLEVEWEPIQFDSSIIAYVLELEQADTNFNEVYRGSETKYHLQDLKPSTSYVLRLCAYYGSEIGNTTLLSLITLDSDLNNWTLSMSSSYAQLNAENTRESLLDGQFTTGAATDANSVGWIKATFPSPVSVASVTIAPMHKNRNVWGPQNGNSGTLQYSHDGTLWTTVGTIAYVEMQQQKIEIDNITAKYWRLHHNSHLGTSSFLFE